MTQSIKCLPHKNEDMSSNPQYPYRKMATFITEMLGDKDRKIPVARAVESRSPGS